MNFHVMANLNVTVSEKPVNDQSYGIVTLDRYYTRKINYKRLRWFVKQHQVHKTK